jgi:hypothetical protein
MENGLCVVHIDDHIKILNQRGVSRILKIRNALSCWRKLSNKKRMGNNILWRKKTCKIPQWA